MRNKIGECLVQAGLITERILQIALAEQARTRERVGAVLVRLKFATDDQIATALGRQLGFPCVSLTDEAPDPAAVVLIPKHVALAHACVAVRRDNNQLMVAVSDPLQFSLVQDLEFQTGYRISPVIATRSQILQAIESGYSGKAMVRCGPGAAGSGDRLAVDAPAGHTGVQTGPCSVAPGALVRRRGDILHRPPTSGIGRDVCGDSAPIIDLVDLLLRSAVATGASDIHLEPIEKGVLVRHRLDGLLKEVTELPKWVHEGLVARVKIMSNMDIAEKRLPQDGHLRLEAGDGRDVDFRVSTLRTLHGEKIVLRILDQRSGAPPLEELGLSANALEELRFFLRHQHGMILVVGPTGSGKTTTLSSSISWINSGHTNITTIEDPIEYRIPGVNQTQVNDKAKLTFPAALRAILRQDPDVVLVGEIRDNETARIAMQAAQTGHLVLSTLHTDDAPSTTTRLMDMGVEPYVIASGLVGVLAQRLVRRLCPACRRQYTPDANTLRALDMADGDAAHAVFYRPAGCEKCNHTGYRGRIALYEVMRVGEKVRRLIARRASEDVVRDAVVVSGMTTLGEDGLSKVKSGVTSADELLRVVTQVHVNRTTCPACRGVVALDFNACPYCGHRLGGSCGACGRALEAEWSYCPSCATGAVPAHGFRERLRPPQLPASGFTGPTSHVP